MSGYTNDLGLARRCTLEHSVMDLFPGGDPKTATFWSGLRPMTPDGPPIIGPTAIRNLFLNTGHGTLGWTMSCGSAAGRCGSDLRPKTRDRDCGPPAVPLRLIIACVARAGAPADCGSERLSNASLDGARRSPAHAWLFYF